MNAERFAKQELLALEQITPLLLELEAFLHRKISSRRHMYDELSGKGREELLDDQGLYWAICEYLYHNHNPPERRVA